MWGQEWKIFISEYETLGFPVGKGIMLILSLSFIICMMLHASNPCKICVELLNNPLCFGVKFF